MNHHRFVDAHSNYLVPFAAEIVVFVSDRINESQRGMLKVCIGHQKQKGSVDELLHENELHDRPDNLTVAVVANPIHKTNVNKSQHDIEYHDSNGNHLRVKHYLVGMDAI